MLKTRELPTLIKCLGLILFSGLIFHGHFADTAIFGKDNRIPINEGSRFYDQSRSTAVAVLSTMYEVRPDGNLNFFSDQLEERICKRERFYKDTSLAWACTGFLIAPDVLATAGHCMVGTGEVRNEPEMYCEAFVWLFGYNESLLGKDPLTDVSPDNMYKCRQIIYAVQEDQAPFRDFALVQLDRPVVGRDPLPLSLAEIKPQERFHMIGYPLGSPAKVSHSAQLMHNDLSRQSFMTNLDALPGNSGSPVFTTKGQVVGLLMGGTPQTSLVKSTEKDSNGKSKVCELYNRCDRKGRSCLNEDDEDFLRRHHGIARSGSDVQRIEPVLKHLLEFQQSRGMGSQGN